MKRGGPSHPKTEQLQLALGIGLAQAVGILELLFHFTAQYAADGFVGKFGNASLAKRLDWPADDADRLVEALKSTNWVDDIPDVGLVVHGWPEHCEDNVHSSLARGTKFFADGTMPSLSRLTKDEQAKIKEKYRELESERRTLKKRSPNALKTPCQALPSHAIAKPSHAIPEGAEPPAPDGAPSADADPQAEDPPASKSSPSPSEFLAAWNSTVPFAQCRVMSEKRADALRVRRSDSIWQRDWREALARIPKTAFLRGEGNTGWKADIDWFLKPDSVTRILEGKYDGSGTTGAGSHQNRNGRIDNPERVATLLSKISHIEIPASEGGTRTKDSQAPPAKPGTH